MELEKITDEYGQLHEEKCDLNNEDGSFDGCDCAMKSLVKEVSDYFLDCRFKALDEQRKEFKKKLERIKLDMDVVVCDCGEPYKDSDPAILINELIKEI